MKAHIQLSAFCLFQRMQSQISEDFFVQETLRQK